MGTDTAATKKRRLRPAQTMRERAERATAQQSKPKRGRRVLHVATAPVRGVRRLGRLPIWKPFRSRPVKFIGRILFPRYLRNSWRELRQVTWPNGKQTRQLTRAVILFSVIFGLFVAAFDYGLDIVFKKVIIK